MLRNLTHRPPKPALNHAGVRPRRRGDRMRRREFITLLVGCGHNPRAHRKEVMTSKAAMLRGRLVSRRSFVMTLAAAAAPVAQAQAPAPGTSAAPAGGPKSREQRMLIVDAQIHIWKSSKPNPNHRQIADYSADDALKEMDEAGVTAAVIHPPGWDPNANALAVEAARQHPNRFAILGNFPLDRPESRSLIDGWKG